MQKDKIKNSGFFGSLLGVISFGFLVVVCIYFVINLSNPFARCKTVECSG